MSTIWLFIVIVIGLLSGCKTDIRYVDEKPSSIELPEAVAGPDVITTPRNIVYLSIGRYEKTFMQNVQARGKEITDYVVAFVNPRDAATGELESLTPAQKQDLDKLVAYRKESNPNARIYIAIGGWRGDDDGFDLVFEEIARNVEKRKLFISDIMALVDAYGADGIDIDWEYPRVQFADEYALFVRELANELHRRNKYLSSAVIGTRDKMTDSGNADAYLDSTLRDFDSINLMAYDMEFENHSTFQHAIDSIDYWVNERKVPPQKVMLGLPVYSRNNWQDWSYITLQHPDQENEDTSSWNQNEFGELVSPQGYSVVNACRNSFEFIPDVAKPAENKTNYYNGLPLIIKKTELALSTKLGGVMFWEAPLDAAKPEYSLIHAAYQVMSGMTVDNICTQNPTWVADQTSARVGKRAYERQ